LLACTAGGAQLPRGFKCLMLISERYSQTKENLRCREEYKQKAREDKKKKKN
jgi:ribosome assembly protein YihI (activator of Der GTPase)